MHGKDCFSEFVKEESFIHAAKVCVCVCVREREREREREKLAAIEAVNIMLPILMVYVEFSFLSIPAG